MTPYQIVVIALFLVLAGPALMTLWLSLSRMKRSRSRNRVLYGVSVVMAVLATATALIEIAAATGAVPALPPVTLTNLGVCFVLSLASVMVWLMVRAACSPKPGSPIYRDMSDAQPAIPKARPEARPETRVEPVLTLRTPVAATARDEITPPQREPVFTSRRTNILDDRVRV